jgi:hypothetical protein
MILNKGHGSRRSGTHGLSTRGLKTVLERGPSCSKPLTKRARRPDLPQRIRGQQKTMSSKSVDQAEQMGLALVEGWTGADPSPPAQ